MMDDGIKIVARLAYLDGQIKGITDYAIWKNGEQLVGCLQKPLKEVIAPMIEEMKHLREKLPDE